TQPTTNPARGPNASRTYTYLPPALGWRVASSAKQSAPKNASAPPSTQATNVSQGRPRWAATSPGVRKIPDPTMIPTTMASPSNRRSDRLRSDTAGRICRKKRRGAALLRPCAPTTVQAAMDLRVSSAPAPPPPPPPPPPGPTPRPHTPPPRHHPTRGPPRRPHGSRHRHRCSLCRLHLRPHLHLHLRLHLHPHLCALHHHHHHSADPRARRHAARSARRARASGSPRGQLRGRLRGRSKNRARARAAAVAPRLEPRVPHWPGSAASLAAPAAAGSRPRPPGPTPGERRDGS